MHCLLQPWQADRDQPFFSSSTHSLKDRGLFIGFVCFGSLSCWKIACRLNKIILMALQKYFATFIKPSAFTSLPQAGCWEASPHQVAVATILHRRNGVFIFIIMLMCWHKFIKKHSCWPKWALNLDYLCFRLINLCEMKKLGCRCRVQGPSHLSCWGLLL